MTVTNKLISEYFEYVEKSEYSLYITMGVNPKGDAEVGFILSKDRDAIERTLKENMQIDVTSVFLLTDVLQEVLEGMQSLDIPDEKEIYPPSFIDSEFPN